MMRWQMMKRVPKSIRVLFSLALALALVSALAWTPGFGLGSASATEATDPVTPVMPEPEPEPEPTVPYLTDFEVHVEGYAPAYISEKGTTLQLEIYVTWSDTSVDYPPPNMQLRYSSSDPSVATVSSSGVVSPLADGIVTVTVTGTTDIPVAGDLSLSDSIDIEVVGQNDGAYVTQVDICDEAGNPYPDDFSLTFTEQGTTAAQKLFAVVTFSDGTHAYTADGSATTVTWLAVPSDIVQMNSGEASPKDGGRVWAIQDGNDGACEILVMASGGMGGAVFSDAVSVFVDTGDVTPSGHMPADSLTIKTYYEDDPFIETDPYSQEWVISLGEFNSMANHYETYTHLTRNNGYGTDTARGVLFAELLNQYGLYEDDIAKIGFKTNDNAQGQLGWQSAAFFFSTARYYYPNYYNGGNTDGAIAAPTMIAVADNWVKGTQYRESCEPNYNGLGSPNDNRFRLVLGSLGPSTRTASSSLYNINSIIVVLSGAPPVGGKGGDGGTGTGDGTGGGSGTGTGTGVGEGTGQGSEFGTGGGGGGDSAATSGQDSSGDGTGAGAEANGGEEGGHRWQVWEMMSNAKTEIVIPEKGNPLAPVAAGGSVLMVLVGGIKMGLWYRREKDQWTPIEV